MGFNSVFKGLSITNYSKVGLETLIIIYANKILHTHCMKYTESSIVTIFHAANVNRLFSCLTFTSLLFENIPFFL